MDISSLLAASPAACRSLLNLTARQQARNRTADELANHILAQVITRGLKRGRDRLILLPPVDDSGSISQNPETHGEETIFHPGDNHSPDVKTPGQLENR